MGFAVSLVPSFPDLFPFPAFTVWESPQSIPYCRLFFSLWYAFRHKAAIVFPQSLSEIWTSLTDTFVALGADPHQCLQTPLYFFLGMWLNNFNLDIVRNPANL